MAVIFDKELLESKKKRVLSLPEQIKIRLMEILNLEIKEANVFSSIQQQGIIAPAIFVTIKSQENKKLLGEMVRVCVIFEIAFLAKESSDSSQAQKMLDRIAFVFSQLCADEEEVSLKWLKGETQGNKTVLEYSFSYDVELEDNFDKMQQLSSESFIF